MNKEIPEGHYCYKIISKDNNYICPYYKFINSTLGECLKYDNGDASILDMVKNCNINKERL